uniref:CobW C-terminal domain-containing protein n=1 Tax=Calcidiscus leptoporus TaxID=127549 RepID=A0A6U5NI70_9EUKA|mmetsp:Transcript_6679/g.15476  ORF Transcript_6679/g.15476 Transcript_6679/m.15476 type:complete len:513 (+) Transcript_6679:553-2091(+)
MAGMISAADAKAGTVKLRFAIGDRVECNCGTWTIGTVVKLFYTQKSFPSDKVAPYQILLDDGRLIYSPADEDRVVRKVIDDTWKAPVDDEEEPERLEADKLPITVVTGFLGAGKTTLVNYILNEQQDKKICVIENEFGSVSIDEQLVKENMSAAEEVIAMDNGCACCSVRGDLVKAFNQIKTRLKDFDLVLLETTGLADPAPVIKTITSDWSLMNSFRIDGVLCLVDCKHILTHLNEVREEGTVNEAVQQVAFSDRVLLNKTDLVSKEELQTVKETIFSINSFAELIESQQSRVPMSKLMDMNSFSLERFEEEIKEYDFDEAVECTDANCDDPDCGFDHSHLDYECHDGQHEHGHAEHGHAEHGHSENKHSENGHHEHGHAAPKPKPKKKLHDLSGVGSLALMSEQPLKSSEFNRFMTRLLQAKSKDLYRSKGVLCFDQEGNKKFVFQGVHEDIQFTEAPREWADGEPKVSKIVFIGRALDKAMLEAGFKECQANPIQRAANADGDGGRFFA